MRSQQKQDADDARVHAQIQAVPLQSEAYRELDLAIHLAAGFVDARHPYWTDGEPKPLKFRMKATGAVLESGFENARRAILSGIAELVEAC